MTEAAVLIVEDDQHLREALLDTLRSESVKAVAAGSGAAALRILDSQDIGLVVSDLQMEPMDGVTLLRTIRKDRPELPAVLMTAYGSIESAVDVMRDGACDYLIKPFPAEKLTAIVARYLPARRVEQGPVAVDPVSIELLRIARRVAATEATVTISGESGCGKEVLAHYIHEHSSRSDAAFVAINCAAIPESMLEAVLFGYEKGAFTGATSAHPGKFEQANNGTLLLDEISEMDVGLQAKLLRVIQEMEVERIGGRKVIPLNVRILATTNRDLQQFVAEGKFREDLYYRLNVFPMTMPPLRERPADIVPLAEHFLGRSQANTAVLADCARRKLRMHSWPGNVRELDNLIQRSVILSSSECIKGDDLAFEIDVVVSTARKDDSGLQQDLSELEYQLILDALANNNSRAAAASALGISPRTLRYKLARMREQGVDIPGDRHE